MQLNRTTGEVYVYGRSEKTERWEGDKFAAFSDSPEGYLPEWMRVFTPTEAREWLAKHPMPVGGGK